MGNSLLSLVRAALYGFFKLKILAPTTGALVGAVLSGVPGAIAGAGLTAAIAKSFADDLAVFRKSHTVRAAAIE
jgi:hypothetical protein